VPTALGDAQGGCQSAGRGRRCIKLIVFVDQCAAVVSAVSGPRIDIISGARDTPEAALQATLEACAERYPGADCRIERQFCAWDDPKKR
jgi:Domain of unknown function (DUF4189)